MAGILYGIISLFSVDVGGEFLAAEIAAHAKGVPCACIDSDIDKLVKDISMLRLVDGAEII